MLWVFIFVFLCRYQNLTSANFNYLWYCGCQNLASIQFSEIFDILGYLCQVCVYFFSFYVDILNVKIWLFILSEIYDILEYLCLCLESLRHSSLRPNNIRVFYSNSRFQILYRIQCIRYELIFFKRNFFFNERKFIFSQKAFYSLITLIVLWILFTHYVACLTNLS